MKAGTKFPLLALPVIALAAASCGNKGYAGYYLFQMGKNSGAHVTASMTLTNDDYLLDGQVHGKKLSIFGQVQTGPKPANSSSSASTEASSQASSEDLDIFENPMGFLTDLLMKGINVPGYYSIGNLRENGRYHFRVGVGLDFLKEILEVDESFYLPPEFIERVVYGEIDDRKIYLTTPVSLEDLKFQFYWYGVDINLANLLKEFAKDDSSSSEQSSTIAQSQSASSASSYPEPVEHEPGTKPTQADIDEINKTYPATHDGELFRTFYTVSVALTRQ